MVLLLSHRFAGPVHAGPGAVRPRRIPLRFPVGSSEKANVWISRFLKDGAERDLQEVALDSFVGSFTFPVFFDRAGTSGAAVLIS